VFFRDGATLDLHYLGLPSQIEDLTREAVLRHAKVGSDGKLRASMNGRVVAVSVAVGDSVEAGQAMVTLEAMKMEHIHAAPVAGRVKALHVSVGEQVGAHRVVAEVEKEPA
jgi:geranyl-CoA carboxylase alpha subunit